MSSDPRRRQTFVSSNARWCRIVITDGDGTTVATWTVGGAGAPDIGVVDELARLRLDVGRRGQAMVLTEVCADLQALISLVGLADVLAMPPA